MAAAWSCSVADPHRAFAVSHWLRRDFKKISQRIEPEQGPTRSAAGVNQSAHRTREMRVAGGRAAESIVCANAYFSDLCALAYKLHISASAYIDILYAFAYFASMDTIARTPQQLGAGIKRYRRQKNLTQGNLGE